LKRKSRCTSSTQIITAMSSSSCRNNKYYHVKKNVSKDRFIPLPILKKFKKNDAEKGM
jgi:hypothetical protein